MIWVLILWSSIQSAGYVHYVMIFSDVMNIVVWFVMVYLATEWAPGNFLPQGPWKLLKSGPHQSQFQHSCSKYRVVVQFWIISLNKLIWQVTKAVVDMLYWSFPCHYMSSTVKTLMICHYVACPLEMVQSLALPVRTAFVTLSFFFALCKTEWRHFTTEERDWTRMEHSWQNWAVEEWMWSSVKA